MDDFLTRLAVRATAVPALQPRVRTPFEPPLENEPAPIDRAISQQTAAPSEPSPRAAAPRAAAEREEPPRPHETAPPSEAIDDAEPPRFVTAESEPRIVPIVVERTSVVERRERVRAEAEEQDVAAPAPARRAVEPPQPAPVRVRAAAKPEVPSRPQSQEERKPIEPLPEREERRDPEPEPRERIVVRTLPPRAAAMRREPAIPSPPPIPPASKEPEIHVTIGRVEIRASAPAPAQQRPSRRGAAPMSLDDYLERRNRKERR